MEEKPNTKTFTRHRNKGEMDDGDWMIWEANIHRDGYRLNYHKSRQRDIRIFSHRGGKDPSSMTWTMIWPESIKISHAEKWMNGLLLNIRSHQTASFAMEIVPWIKDLVCHQQNQDSSSQSSFCSIKWTTLQFKRAGTFTQTTMFELNCSDRLVKDHKPSVKPAVALKSALWGKGIVSATFLLCKVLCATKTLFVKSCKETHQPRFTSEDYFHCLDDYHRYFSHASTSRNG